jgi:hypothetical protein
VLARLQTERHRWGLQLRQQLQQRESPREVLCPEQAVGTLKTPLLREAPVRQQQGRVTAAPDLPQLQPRPQWLKASLWTSLMASARHLRCPNHPTSHREGGLGLLQLLRLASAVPTA